jgi:hypothetical protein
VEYLLAHTARPEPTARTGSRRAKLKVEINGPRGDDPGKRFAGPIASGWPTHPDLHERNPGAWRNTDPVGPPRSSTLWCRYVNTGRAFMVMERYVVTQDHEELWWVSQCEKKLYSYPEEARVAALALAKAAAARGIQSTVLVIPPSTDVEVHETRKRRRFSGM